MEFWRLQRWWMFLYFPCRIDFPSSFEYHLFFSILLSFFLSSWLKYWDDNDHNKTIFIMTRFYARKNNNKLSMRLNECVYCVLHTMMFCIFYSCWAYHQLDTNFSIQTFGTLENKYLSILKRHVLWLNQILLSMFIAKIVRTKRMPIIIQFAFLRHFYGQWKLIALRLSVLR